MPSSGKPSYIDFFLLLFAVSFPFFSYDASGSTPFITAIISVKGELIASNMNPYHFVTRIKSNDEEDEKAILKDVEASLKTTTPTKEKVFDHLHLRTPRGTARLSRIPVFFRLSPSSRLYLCF